MNELILCLVVIVLGFVCVFLFNQIIKKNNELKDIKEKIEAEETERKKKDEAKETMHTGDSVTDFNNSIEQLQNLKKSTKK